MRLLMSQEIYDRIYNWMELASPNEIAWVGTLELVSPATLEVQDIYLLKQRTSSASADIDQTVLMELAVRLCEEGKQLRWHGHSHVRMSTSPSGTDTSEFETNVRDAGWFVASIFNLKGEVSSRIGSKIEMLPGTKPIVYSQALDTEVSKPDYSKEWKAARKEEFEAATAWQKTVALEAYARWASDDGPSWRGETMGVWQEKVNAWRARREIKPEPQVEAAPAETIPSAPDFFAEARSVQEELALQSDLSDTELGRLKRHLDRLDRRRGRRR